MQSADTIPIAGPLLHQYHRNICIYLFIFLLFIPMTNIFLHSTAVVVEVVVVDVLLRLIIISFYLASRVTLVSHSTVVGMSTEWRCCRYPYLAHTIIVSPVKWKWKNAIDKNVLKYLFEKYCGKIQKKKN